MDTNPLLALISIVFGILVIAFPTILNWVIGLFLIILGLWMVYERYISKKE